MYQEKELKTIAKNIIKKTSYFDQIEVILGTDDTTTIRFANNLISQPVSVLSAWLKIRLIKDKKIAVVNTNSFAQKAIDQALTIGKKLCLLQKKDKNFVSLPKSSTVKIDKSKTFIKTTAALKEKKLIQLVAPVINLSKQKNLIASGKLEKSSNQLAILNSLGTWQYQPSAAVFFSTVVRNDKTKGSGYTEALGKKIKDLNIKKVGQKAINTALQSAFPKKIQPQNYEVILLPGALQELLTFFSWLGPNARIYHEDVSFLKGKLNKLIFSPQLTITDMPINNLLPSFFDFEGYPKKNLAIVAKGKIKNIAYDSYYAQKYKQKNTGHALPAPNVDGPMPSHLVIKPGQSSLNQMIAQVKKGLLINRLWYIRVVHYKKLILTGMTRDGTFYIENGKIKYPVANLRFTDSIPHIFKNIKEIGQNAVWQRLMLGTAKVPPLRLSKLKFTS